MLPKLNIQGRGQAFIVGQECGVRYRGI